MEKKVDGSGEGWEAMARGRGRDGGWRHPQMREGLSFEMSLPGRAFYRLRFFLGSAISAGSVPSNFRTGVTSCSVLLVNKF